jgi:predicted DNA-binding transcriptional regulator AlpA
MAKPKSDPLTTGGRILCETEAAQALGVSPRSLQRWRRDGGGPSYIRAGARRVLYDAAEIDRWTAARTFPHRSAELAQAAS